MLYDAPRTRVLVVDDEASALDAIRHAVRKDQKRWDAAFALGGDAALVELRAGAFEVVLAGIGTPEGDGLAFLEKVRDTQPLALRFVLSGCTDRAVNARSYAVAHHVLTKPCEAVVLRGMLERASDLSRRIGSPALLRLVGSLPSLPGAPEPIWPAAAANGSRGESRGDNVLAREPQAAERFLRMAKTIFGIKSAFLETDRVIVQLGEDVASLLVRGAQAFTAFEARGVSGAAVESVQNHSLLTAWLASSMLDDPDDARTAFAAGLLHDIGKLVLALAHRAAGSDAPGSDDDDDDDDDDGFGVSHAALGAHLVSTWGLPLPVVEALAHHHHPPPVAGSFSVPWAVHLADALVHEAESGHMPDILSALGTQRTTVAFMTGLEQRMTLARRQLSGRTEALRAPPGR